jgi:hypothetical protein
MDHAGIGVDKSAGDISNAVGDDDYSTGISVDKRATNTDAARNDSTVVGDGASSSDSSKAIIATNGAKIVNDAGVVAISDTTFISKVDSAVFGIDKDPAIGVGYQAIHIDGPRVGNVASVFYFTTDIQDACYECAGIVYSASIEYASTGDCTAVIVYGTQILHLAEIIYSTSIDKGAVVGQDAASCELKGTVICESAG